MTRLPPAAGAHDLPSLPRGVEGGHLDIEGERYYRIRPLDGMAPFLVALASDSDQWLFISSTGALTAGRRDPDCALFPYYTDDRLHDGWDQTGSRTLIGVHQGGRRHLWEPLSARQRGLYRVTRSLAKSVLGNSIRFEEENHDLGLTFFYSWHLSERFGFVRRAGLSSQRTEPVELELLDGVENLLPSGITRRFQLEYSTLADGYKKSELDVGTGLGLFLLSSIPTDKAEPSESLRATTVWSAGLPGARHLLSSSQLDRFRDGVPLDNEIDVRGRRGAYLVEARLPLRPGEAREWLLCAEVAQDAAAVASTLAALRSPDELRRATLDDVARGSRELRRLVGSADGLQHGGDELVTWGHYANTLYNVLRGGVPLDGYAVPRGDFVRFLEACNVEVAARHRALLAALPERIDRAALVAEARRAGDPDLERLAREYLPLAFCRRHGDPSRPWNLFSIALRDEAGQRLLEYQGNWRDIFQNWEALGLAFPELLEAMITKFVDCSTADGYNPYRVTRAGFDWEVIDPHDEWSFIGYWGDHQVIYLCKLLERLRERRPDAIAALLPERLFVHANVPYRLHGFEQLLADPQRTIDFDGELDRSLREARAARGTDALLLTRPDGTPVRASLMEKLLLVVLARLSSYVPGAGIWMNTQRPEWNDANNALVGHGVSVVTLCYLRRFVSFLRRLVEESAAASFPVAEEIADLSARTLAALHAHRSLLQPGRPLGDADRLELLSALGRAASDYRGDLYRQGLTGRPVDLSAREIVTLCELTLAHLDDTIRRNRRDDGLYHAYNLMKLEGDGVKLRRLPEMLEGQVAVLSAGLLDPAEALSVLDALRSSRLYRADQDSYLLYPDRALPRFLDKNVLPDDAVAASPLLGALLERGDRRVVVRDVAGRVHFHASLRNAGLLAEALDRLPQAEYGPLLAKGRTEVLALYEQVFDHQSFTGRSGTFYKYEGLGCIYWHMVSKLRLAVQEILEGIDAGTLGAAPATVDRLRAHYLAIRGGLGLYKAPDRYGALPTDPHSHTPSFAGAQQPGMTGQVKEDILARQGDLGLVVRGGCIQLRPSLLADRAFLASPAEFVYHDVDGAEQRLPLGPGTLAFTTCQVPVVVHRAGPPRLEVILSDRRRLLFPSLSLDVETSSSVFARSGLVARIDAYFGLDPLLGTGHST